MRKSQGWQVLVRGALVVAACLVLGAVTPVHAQATALQNSDCVKCHEAQPQQIEAKGMKHKTAVGCMDCHVGHPPKVSDIVPKCSMCHVGNPHFELPNCGQCHSNAHTPLELNLSGDLKAECITCHAPIGQQLTANPSAHNDVACNFCHADTHGMIPECVLCHKPHSQEMTQKDCASCHQAHKPLLVTYDDKMPSIHCAACHGTAYTQLTANQSKHQSLACVYCHQDKHKMVPLCSDCHGTPHAAGIHQRFPSCGECHNIAHDLNNWPAQAQPKGK
ncbi:hypothetical protein [Geoalkalibacter sp.]|uniref:hypothetical protein n=1 Tax=Geoalkalibacter sp. TaxID=3041440 RepID=UPI00272E38A4|nr:hypothetical protein [Geoalkalibacter sp.]